MAIVLLMVHAMFQPYKERWLNVLDTLFITDLILLSLLHGSTANVVFESPGLMIFKDILVHLLVLLPLVYFVSLCLWLVLKRVYNFLLNFTCKGNKKRLRNLGDADSDTGAPYRPFTAEREPLLFQQSINSSVFNMSRSTDHKSCKCDVTDREYCDVPKPKLPTTSSVCISESTS